jgi:hydroxyacylglutathione hydrolase
VFLKRFYHEGLAQASYLIGSESTGQALIVDANRNLEQYVAGAEEAGLRITHVAETHIHADYLSGSRDLARLTGARLFLSAEGGSDWQYGFAADSHATLLHDGDRFMVGELALDVVHTPGHTPEHLIFIVTDTPASKQPVGALTGDFIFVGDVGRPDLLERAAGIEGTMRAGAKLLFESLRRFTEHFPDYLQLWPAHGAGSACGKSLGAVPQTTLGYEKLVNWAFQIDDESRFVEAVLEGQPDAPPYFAVMKRLNRDGPPSRRPPGTPRRDAGALREALRRGDMVIDLRPTADFADGFIRGTINIPLSRSFVDYSGWLVPFDRDVYLLADATDDTRAREAQSELAMIGIDRVAGWFGADILEQWTAAGGALSTQVRLNVDQVASSLERGEVELLDVRTESEWREGHIAGARLAPLGRLAAVAQGLPLQTPVALVCQSGSRSAIGASVLAAHGYTAVANLSGGMAEWERSGRPLERDVPMLTSS